MAKQHDDLRDPDWIAFAPAQHFRGTAGDDNFVGTAGRDKFHIKQGGNDKVSGGQGNDTIYAGASLTADDRFDGGTGADRLVLNGDYSGGLTLQTDTISRIEFMYLEGGFQYSITLAPNVWHDTNSFFIDARQSDGINLDGSEIDYIFGVAGSGGDDMIIGGSIENRLTPGAGHDVMTGGAGLDIYDFNLVTDSSPVNGDVITNFDVDKDFIDLSTIDAKPNEPGDQQFHFGATPRHVGDVTVTYNAGQNVTFVNVFTDKDANPDMVIQLLGDHTDLTTANFVL